ncbi:MAG: hypothetical protein OEZ04_13300 [Nitrospinota bacterium]|nr:hypothetical protein [Nitrospinota bacterium]
MRKTIISLAALVVGLASSNASMAQEQKLWTMAFTANNGSWSASSLDNQGSQSMAYFQVSRQGGNWGGALTTKFANTSYKTEYGGPDTLDISSMTGTSISTFYNVKRGATTLRAGLDMDLPTGKNSYSDAEVEKLILDRLSEDLMLVTSYGEGTNIIPHALLAHSFGEKLTLGFGAKYEITGKYDITEDTEGDELNPGDRTFIVANAAYSWRKGDFILLTATYASATEDTQKDIPVFKQGVINTVEIRSINKLSNGMTLIISASSSSQEKNSSLGGDNKLVQEILNSNNNITQLYGSGIYPYTRNMSITGMAGYKAAGANGYVDSDPLYDGGRTVLFVEPGVMWTGRKDMRVSFKGRYSMVDDKKDAFSSEDTSYSLINLDLGLIWAF